MRPTAIEVVPTPQKVPARRTTFMLVHTHFGLLTPERAAQYTLNIYAFVGRWARRVGVIGQDVKGREPGRQKPPGRSRVQSGQHQDLMS